ncbi:amidase [Mameliella sediminis]|uniref:amidase n=1 Tax=Mameliella sediminis TaxID=2836866 RepID=UPI001C4430A3|nr:amidase family protein [Mameliella sediminis]MBV7393231.1 amidase [Mameliella sediminis]
MSLSDLAEISAVEALARFRDRSLSPVELTKAVLARAEATEPAINALPLRYPEAALAAAQEAEARYLGRAAAPRALDGLCVAIKDSTDLAGQPSAAGSLLSGDAPAQGTSIANSRVLAAGGIPHARSATPEYSCASVTWSRKWGVTRNPWDTTRTPGGSSGGAAAALAVGSATLAVGSDIAGSIRIPAACCGVVGYKPPRGRVPQDPPFNFDPYCHTGPMARSVADVALLQNILSGPHDRDPLSLPGMAHPLTPGAPLDGQRLRIAWSENLGGFAVDDAVRANFRASLDLLADLGAALTEVDPGWGPDVVEAALGHLRGVFGNWIDTAAGDRHDRLTSYARAFAEDARALPPGAELAALTKAGEMGETFGRIMATHDLFVCPTLACPPVAAEHDQSRDRIEISGIAVDPMIGWVLTVPFNMLSVYPVLSVPSGLTGGVPLGLQMVARPTEEDLLFRAAQSFEALRGPWFRAGTPRPNL